MSFHSILFEESADRNGRETVEAPAFFGDLNLDRIVDAITAGGRNTISSRFFAPA